MKEAYLIRAERKNRPKCMDCTWFKTDPNDLPDFGECIKNHWNVISSELACADFEWEDGKVEGKASDICPKCKNGEVIVWKGVSNIVCKDPYDGMTKTLDADSDICCSMFEVRKEKEPFNLNMSREQLELKILDLFEEKDRLNGIINNLEKEKADHLKGIERLKKSQEKLQNQVKNLQTTNEESYKREEKLEDKVHKLKRRLLEENKRFSRLDTEFLMPLAHVLYPREAKICKPYSEILDDIKRLVDKSETLEQLYDNIHYTLYKDWSDDSISCPRDIPSDVEMIEDLKKRAADQEVTIKALLITIKEMCKDDETNE